MLIIGVQTFIRNATGKALTDSPALNAHSRAVLIPLARPPTNLATSVSVPGPGPQETHTMSSTSLPAISTSKPPPANPGTGDLLDMSESPTAADVDDDDAVPNNANDPYSNLDGAFGNYLADAPQPMSTIRKGTQGDLDDFL